MSLNKNQSYLSELSFSFYLDDRTTVICDWVLFPIVCQTINIFGIITNILNIVCFVKQGLKDSTNISLLGLSVSDLASLITLAVSCIFYTPAFVEADLPCDNLGVTYLVFMMPHFMFTRVSGCITALLAMERCLSIVAPLKVKRLITPKRAAMIVGCIFIIFTFSTTPVFIVNSLGLIFSISRNKTVVGLIFTKDKEQVELFTFAINNFLIPFCAFLIVAVCTVILAVKLRNSSKWRKTTINDVQAQKMSSRNKKVSKMVISISTLFISCYVPVSAIMLALGLVPEMSIYGKYFKASKLLGGCSLILESINSSVNIFIYHHMSTKYRDTFQTLFLIKNTKNQQKEHGINLKQR